MKHIFTATAPPEAHMIKGYLESSGIRAVVQGEAIYAAIGGVPLAPESAPSVWVAAADAEHAAQLVADFFRPAPPGEHWHCPGCGEVLTAQFTACWQCGCERLAEPSATRHS